DSSGKSMAASALWLRLASKAGKDLERLDFARHTNWIDVQKLILQDSVSKQVDLFKRWTDGTSLKMGKLVSEELSGQRKINLGEHEGNPLITSLSASTLEAYWKCPYTFFARAHLGLFDEEDMEVEPTPSRKGQWIHAAVENILN